jgi:regulator of nucleoside diphosphate kinase
MTMNMKYKNLVIETKEFALMKRLIRESGHSNDHIYLGSVQKLSEEMMFAKTVDDTEMPADVVRLNSVVTIRTPMNKNIVFSLVLPENSNIAENRLSILAPMGLALFGYAKGDSISWEFPSGVNEIKILKVEQPVPVDNPAK